MYSCKNKKDAKIANMDTKSSIQSIDSIFYFWFAQIPSSVSKHDLILRTCPTELEPNYTRTYLSPRRRAGTRSNNLSQKTP